MSNERDPLDARTAAEAEMEPEERQAMRARTLEQMQFHLTCRQRIDALVNSHEALVSALRGLVVDIPDDRTLERAIQAGKAALKKAEASE